MSKILFEFKKDRVYTICARFKLEMPRRKGISPIVEQFLKICKQIELKLYSLSLSQKKKYEYFVSLKTRKLHNSYNIAKKIFVTK